MQIKALWPLQMEISMAQKASTFDTRRATGMMSNTRTCHQASPLQTLGADPVLPGLHRAMALIDIVATTWLVLMLPTSRLRPPHLCKQQARCVSKEPPPLPSAQLLSTVWLDVACITARSNCSIQTAT